MTHYHIVHYEIKNNTANKYFGREKKKETIYLSNMLLYLFGSLNTKKRTQVVALETVSQTFGRAKVTRKVENYEHCSS